ncbi:uncharacterized protein LOC111640947 isoform X2 [Centruroides sculpturatus]|uniref:uncharacterized protein LOC111640947 isoform X2 n=1 Tax=Centruroides sculpturatus TaxID=218467 RepID=UPI000C6D0A3C|nr:uncharacterized protein LOC111640947 isoform X2 [Centruroides sculpturatus]
MENKETKDLDEGNIQEMFKSNQNLYHKTRSLYRKLVHNLFNSGKVSVVHKNANLIEETYHQKEIPDGTTIEKVVNIIKESDFEDKAQVSFYDIEEKRDNLIPLYGVENIFVQCKQCGEIFCDARELFSQNRTRVKVKFDGREIYRHLCKFCNEIFDRKLKTEKHMLQHIIAKQIKCKKCSLEKIPEEVVVKKQPICMNSKIPAPSLIAVHCEKCRQLFCRGDEIIEKYITYKVFRDIDPENIKEITIGWKCGICDAFLRHIKGRSQLDVHEHLWMHMINEDITCDKCINININQK